MKFLGILSSIVKALIIILVGLLFAFAALNTSEASAARCNPHDLHNPRCLPTPTFTPRPTATKIATPQGPSQCLWITIHYLWGDQSYFLCPLPTAPPIR